MNQPQTSQEPETEKTLKAKTFLESCTLTKEEWDKQTETVKVSLAATWLLL